MLPPPYLNLSWNIFAPTPSTGFGSPRLAPMLGSPSMSPISLPIVPGQPTGLFVGQWIYSTHSRPTCLVPLLTPRVVSLLLCCRSTITTSSSTFAVSWLALLAHPLNPPCSLLVAYPLFCCCSYQDLGCSTIGAWTFLSPSISMLFLGDCLPAGRNNPAHGLLRAASKRFLGTSDTKRAMLT